MQDADHYYYVPRFSPDEERNRQTVPKGTHRASYSSTHIQNYEPTEDDQHTTGDPQDNITFHSAGSPSQLSSHLGTITDK